MHLLSPSLPRVADLVSGLHVMAALLGCLLVATILVKRGRRPGPPGALQLQVTSWWYLLPPVFLAWAIYPWGVPALVLAISALAARELAALTHHARPRLLTPAIVALLAVQALLYALDLGLWNVALMLAFSGLKLNAATFDPDARRDAVLQVLFALQAAGLACLAALPPVGMAREAAASWFLYVCIVTALNDIGQFLAGSRFGRHKLATRISPNKTWQGVGGGLLASVGVSMAVGHALALAALPWLAGMGVVLSVAGLAGDLLFSAGKRLLGVKDYSHLIPGHGGILDRVDSLVLTAPALLIALRLA
ncbi:MAG: phosphatidate cytidylyltransferase [Betaproteobacteria bacterium]